MIAVETRVTRLVQHLVSQFEEVVEFLISQRVKRVVAHGIKNSHPDSLDLGPHAEISEHSFEYLRSPNISTAVDSK